MALRRNKVWKEPPGTEERCPSKASEENGQRPGKSRSGERTP